MDFLSKPNPTKEEYVYIKCMQVFGMKKLDETKRKKIIDQEENKGALEKFMNPSNFNNWIIAIRNGDMISLNIDLPPISAYKQKACIILKGRVSSDVALSEENIAEEIIVQEFTKNVLENLSLLCQDIYLPVLSNPLNQIGWSDLVTKDLMDKLHNFLAHIYVTIGQVKGRTLLPLPPQDVTTSDKTSSKDKAHILEGAIITWTKQIKNVLKQDPESALKAGGDPDPLTEIDFWKNKADNLNSIYDQLQSERIKKVLKFLEQNKSTYTTPFGKLQKDVQQSRIEANSNFKYLSTLTDLFVSLTDDSRDFTEITDLFVQIMHVILLIWNHSPYYNTPARLVVLIREICNAIISQAMRYINGEMIFGHIKNEEEKEAHEKLSTTLDVCSKFKDAYFEYKAKANNTWKITTNALFVRLDSFAERCQDIMHLTSTIIQFNKLQKIEIGGTKGKNLTATITQIFDEFSQTVEEFTKIEYDIMDISIRRFDDDFYKFRCRIKELERRLASVLTQGFDDQDTIIGKFKLLDSFEGLLTRPIIQDELEKKHITLLELYKNDLKVVQSIFLEGKALVDKVDERAPIFNNLPPIAGALNWTNGLYERIKEPMDKLSTLSNAIQDREEYKDVQKLYASICKNLREFEDQKIKQWEQGVEENTEEKLNKTLLYREEGEEGFVYVNFDPILIRLLREVKYLLLLGIDVPGRASTLYERVEVYRTQTGNLDLIVNMYNNILATLLPVEKPLLAERIIKMDGALEPGIAELKWNSQNIDPFIKNSMVIVTEVDNLVKKMKENVNQMQDRMAKWAQHPLFERKSKPMAPDDLEQTHQSVVMARHQDIKDDGKEIHKFMKDTGDAIKPDKKSDEWLAYVDYLNGLVMEGMTNAIVSSLKYVSDQISIQYNRHHQLMPIFDVKVDLVDREVTFDPPIGRGSRGNGILDIISRIQNDFITISIQLPRLDSGQGDFLVEIKDQFSILEQYSVISSHMSSIGEETQKFLSKYREQEFLWKEDLEESFQAFLDTGEEVVKKVKNDDGEEEDDESYEWMSQKVLQGVVTKKPELEKFDEKVVFLTQVKSNISEMKTPTDIGWLKVNSQPLKNALENIVTSWINKYTNFLMNNTVTEINNITSFIENVTSGIKEVPEKAETQREKDLLMQVMTHLRDVKMIKDHTINEIVPMRDAIQLLKKHGVHMDEDFLVKLENCRTQLYEVSERALGPIKEQILPLQNEEANNIKQRLRHFESTVIDFRVEFQKSCPYHNETSSMEIINDSYGTISVYYEKLMELEDKAREYNNLETLFELQKSGYKQLKDCKNELISLKYMWDLIALVDYQFNAWKSTLWDKIDTDALVSQIKDIQTKQTNPQGPQNKEIKNYRAFMALNDRVKNMYTILPLISDLHSPYMMERHWKRLMHITGKDIAFNSPNFCLEDLIKLELYKYAEEVSELVDSAQKESKIESNLAKIEKIWEGVELPFQEYKDTFIIGNIDETIEFVETHQMELMGMMSQKDVEEFKEKVMHWQRTLKQCDTVITMWIKVQRNWQRLETIFLASEDIRAQLPDETKRFEKVDTDWKDLMREAQDEPQFISACTSEGRDELLYTFNQEIEQCEKALNDYLEQKKKIFPRFYFVSNQALLDILSNGNNPEIVNTYIGDCFDGMRNVKFYTEESEPRPYKKAEGMYSKEGEYVGFNSEHFLMNGAVENYLVDLESQMKSCLRKWLTEAKSTADNWEIEKKRQDWLEDYCAQISLVATQIIWTEEVTRAFDELEGGNESSMKDYLTLIIQRLRCLIDRVRTDLTAELRVKIITIITIDVHERDAVESFVLRKVVEGGSFAWQSQLKFYWKQDQDNAKNCFAKICDWETKYSYEYVGNCGRLVITPLTDRCYITLTQALNLTMGGAPAGPAGTGKTETTKDLGRALGLQVVVFNCSDQMNYQSMAQIFMGLSQTGAWGCFDEFNRISIEVLSVVATQVKTVLDALKEQKFNPAKSTFLFGEDEIGLRNTVGFFITMNPGYAGRTELPENLKALFRSCAMVVPDITLICENMLMSEGFTQAKELSKKFMTLYDLSKSLLSKQTHYDWGLRAVKSVLRQAGKLKREDPDISEDPILMRALRDFNWPKIVIDDRQIFLGLIKDLFPGISAEQKANPILKEAVENVTKKAGLQGEDGFILKCIQLGEILEVRHCCFIIGNTGSAKTRVWKILADACNYLGQESVYDIIDPKAVTSDELFGCLNPKTKEWKDGVLSTMMRNMCKNLGKYNEGQLNKWVILDGDIDPEWIESLNTVMDDNKVLTLVSQERIPLTPSMRLILEVSNLRNATPATVSRGGVLFINDSDIGWRPYLDTWMDQFKKRNDEYARNTFTLAISHYLNENFIDDINQKETVCPMVVISYIQTMTTIIDALYYDFYGKKENNELIKNLKEAGKEEDIKNIYDAFFAFAIMWSFGAALTEDKISFNNVIKHQTKGLKFPDAGQCYDYYFNPLEGKWQEWMTKVPTYEADPEGLFQNIIVPSADSVRQKYLLNLHVKRRKPVLYVGAAGTGKTTIIKDYFNGVDKETIETASINFNSYTDSKTLQAVMESNVEKRAGRTYGPRPNHVLIFFMDDLNMPFVDKYGTQSPICLIRQLQDYGIMYDRDHLEEKKELVDCLFTACMNPKSGSFIIDSRLQRHYSVFAMMNPDREILSQIYTSILGQHMSTFDNQCQQMVPRIINATCDIFAAVTNSAQFMPTARKFHYQFNMRDFAKIIQNIMLTVPQLYKGKPEMLARMWIHECERVYSDRLIVTEDLDKFKEFMLSAVKNYEQKPDDLFPNEEFPNICTSFVSACEGHDKSYMQIRDKEQLKKVLEDKLAEYCENVAMMDLVLFDQAMEHVCRIARIVDQPAGNALLVGVGGSGKQSLSKLASFILGYDVARIVVSTNYTLNDLKLDLQTFYTKSGVTGVQLLFLLTDTQIQDEKFLVYINDMLSSGWISDLFTKEELEGILGKIRNEAKSAGYMDVPDQLFEYYLNKVRMNLHVGLCFSPVGEAFRIRARKFPGIINCTSIDWFHEWPRNALIDVANRFLSEIEFPQEDNQENISEYMADVHQSIEAANQDFLLQERRNNYTTPTSYLELIKFYKNLLNSKRDKITDQINRLEIGLGIMKATTEQVEGLQKQLEIKMVDVEEKRAATNELIEIVGKESLEAEKEQEAANVEEEKTNQLASDAKKTMDAAGKELEEALPAMKAAEEAVNCLTKNSIQELKSLAKPPEECVQVTKTVLLLRGEKKNFAWGNAQKMMNNPPKFLEEVVGFNGNEIDQWILDQCKPIIDQPWFNFNVMKGKSTAAAYLCSWVVNIIKYNSIYKKVKPLMDSAGEAEQQAKDAEAALQIVKAKVEEINEKVAGLRAKLEEAENTKARVEAEAQELQDQLDLAQRLVGGLADENKRWAQNVESYKHDRVTMVGDALISASFVSYIGPFSAKFRKSLWEELWLPKIGERKIPATEGVDPLNVLANDADQAVWKNQGLPADRMSLENASVISSCSRWPLIIDPQLQGQKWIKGKEGNEMTVLNLSNKGWLKKIELAVTNGQCLMIESIGQELDAVLDPLLSKAISKKGKNLYTVRLGAEDIEYSMSFRLYLQTKLINPHYKPEIAAQCTIINFIVTESGLEDQLLAMVVRVEKPDLEQTKEDLVNKQNQFQIQLAQLEDQLLTNLSNADPATILQNKALIDSLEVTKSTSTDIMKQQKIAKETEIQINIAREVYRRVAAEGAMLYFLLIQLCIVDHMYQYSLESYITFFFKAIEKTALLEDDEQRVLALREEIRKTIYQWVSRGLFEAHKQIFMCLITFRLMQKNILEVEYTLLQMQFLFKCPLKSDVPNTLKEWLPDVAWYSVQKLVELEGFENFSQNLEKEAPNRFKDWYNELTPETEKLPLDWKKLESQPFQKMLVLRCLRPDRITVAMDDFIRKTLPNGSQYVDMDSTASFKEILDSSIIDSTPATPIFFILSPGADPVVTVEALTTKYQIVRGKSYHNVSMGQGQEQNALTRLEIGHKEGHWVMLQNIHLMPKWLLELEKKLDECIAEGSHPSFRLFLSADPSKGIPIGILEKSIKLTNEPPQGLKANMKRAFSSFLREEFEEKETKIKTILFALCYFHSVVLERRKFGPKGWNMKYPFSGGDLRDSGVVLQNYMEQNAASGKIPWDDLKYIFGEIMYGGHIVDDWDRRLCKAYLETLMTDAILDEGELFPFVEGKGISFKCPPISTYEKYLEYIDVELPGETPLAFGMHPNAEIDFRTTQCNNLFKILLDLQPKDTGGDDGGQPTKQDKTIEFMGRINDEVQLDSNKVNIEDIISKLNEEREPFQNVFLQECEYMNVLILEILRSLGEIELAFKGELTMTDKMENLIDSIFMDRVPDSWAKLAFPSTRGLGSWLDNLKHRLDQLNQWKEEPTQMLKVVFLNRLFNPQSFLTSIQQAYSRSNQAELNRLYIQTDITKKMFNEVTEPPRDGGAYVFGFHVEGARWETSTSQLDESLPKKQFSVVPVVNCKAQHVPAEGKEEKGIYHCPVYKTENRGNTYVFTAQMKTKAPPQKWILAGVSIILDVEGVADAYVPGKEIV